MKTSKTFRKKILLLLIVAFVSQFITIYLILVYDRYKQAKNQQITMNELFVNNESVYVEKLLYLAVVLINDISRNNEVLHFLQSDTTVSVEMNMDFYIFFRNRYINEYGNTFSTIAGYMKNNDLMSLKIYSPNENLAFTDFMIPYNELDLHITRLALSSREITVINDDESVSLFKPLYLNDSDEPTIIMLSLSSEIFTREYNKALNEQGNISLEITDKHYSLNKPRTFTGKTITSSADFSVPNYSWINGRLIYEFPEPIIRRRILPDILMITLSFAGLLIAVIVILYFITRYLTNRLYFLVDEINSDLTSLSDAKRVRKNDEFDIIRSKILDLTQIINQKEHALLQNEIEKKVVETRLLQELFNPHFLYNTLSSLKCKLKKKPKA